MKMGVCLCTLLSGLRVYLLKKVGFVCQRGNMLGFPPGLLRHGSKGWPALEVSDADVGFGPFSVSMLVELCSFMSSLYWPPTVDDLGGWCVFSRATYFV